MENVLFVTGVSILTFVIVVVVGAASMLIVDIAKKKLVKSDWVKNSEHPFIMEVKIRTRCEMIYPCIIAPTQEELSKFLMLLLLGVNGVLIYSVIFGISEFFLYMASYRIHKKDKVLWKKLRMQRILPMMMHIVTGVFYANGIGLASIILHMTWNVIATKYPDPISIIRNKIWMRTL